MIRRPPRSTRVRSSAASDVYKRQHLEMLIFGLVLSIALMALTANFIAKLLEKHNWLGYLGLAIIAYVAVQMLWQGSAEVYQMTGVQS